MRNKICGEKLILLFSYYICIIYPIISYSSKKIMNLCYFQNGQFISLSYRELSVKKTIVMIRRSPGEMTNCRQTFGRYQRELINYLSTNTRAKFALLFILVLFLPRPEVLTRAHRFLAEDYEGKDVDVGYHRRFRYACGCVCGCG